MYAIALRGVPGHIVGTQKDSSRDIKLSVWVSLAKIGAGLLMIPALITLAMSFPALGGFGVAVGSAYMLSVLTCYLYLLLQASSEFERLDKDRKLAKTSAKDSDDSQSMILLRKIDKTWLTLLTAVLLPAISLWISYGVIFE